jgi:hypothetical protein
MKATAWRRGGPELASIAASLIDVGTMKRTNLHHRGLPLRRHFANFAFVGTSRYRRLPRICGKQSGDSDAANAHDKLIGLPPRHGVEDGK